MARLGVAPENLDPRRYAGPKINVTPVTEANRQPTVLDRLYPLFTLWRVRSPVSGAGAEGELWYLARFVDSEAGFNPGDAIWILLSGGSSGPMVSVETDDGAPNVVPDGAGEIQIFGGSGISVTGQGPGKTITVALSGGGTAIDSVDVDFATPPGVDPVVPTAAGLISIFGNAVANGTNLNAPVATHTRALNQFHIDVQLSAAVAATPADPFDAGIASFNDAHFTVDGNGFVSLAGGGIAMDQFDVQFATPPGTDPVVPDGTGTVVINGAVVANATNANTPLASHSRAANALNMEIQVSTDLAVAPGDTNDAGIASFDVKDFTVDADGFVVAKSGFTQGITNLGFDYDGGTGVFSVTGANGTALSATNPAYVTLQDETDGGKLITVAITEDQSFIDDVGASQIIGNLFGTTTGRAWADPMPFFVYAVINDAQNFISFMISRIPNRTFSPVAGNIGTSAAANASTPGSLFALEDSGGPITPGDFDSNTALLIGSFRMVKSAADDWTVQAMGVTDGIGQFSERVRFGYPAGHNGAGAGTYFTDSLGTGTMPTFNQQSANYSIRRDGRMDVIWNQDQTSGGGVGAGNLRFHLPISTTIGGPAVQNLISNISRLNFAAGNFTTFLARLPGSTTTSTFTEIVFTGTAVALLTPAGITTDTRQLGIMLDYTYSQA